MFIWGFPRVTSGLFAGCFFSGGNGALYEHSLVSVLMILLEHHTKESPRVKRQGEPGHFASLLPRSWQALSCDCSLVCAVPERPTWCFVSVALC